MFSTIKNSLQKFSNKREKTAANSSDNHLISNISNNQITAPTHKRFLSNSKERVHEYLEAARAYPEKLPEGSLGYLYRKPYDQRQGHGDFFLNMNNILGLINAMSLPAHASILEVGCGPGWVTEILALLGYKVTAFDPSDDFIEIARNRIFDAASARKYPDLEKNVTFIVNTLEDIEFPEDSFDGIIFYDILHHIIDEEKGLNNCSKWIRDSGALGIIEGAWNPGNIALEAALNEEMKNYGTLESPFTPEYLDFLLQKNGFTEIERLVGINGFFPLSALDLSPRSIMSLDPNSRNDLIARKTGYTYSSKQDANTKVELIINACTIENDLVKLVITVKNIGDTILLGGTTNKPGLITLAMRRGTVGDNDFMEAGNRVTLAEDIHPGHQVDLNAVFNLPIQFEHGWVIDAIAEHICWLSSKGSHPIQVISKNYDQ
jgi:2-polyprenyl-3-methyl-5-hydroxy-6-metoxy-1,4-benzoquinol methylase